MKSFTTLTFLAVLASTVSSQATNGCDENYSGTFEIAPYNVTDKVPQQVETVCTTNPVVSLKNGVLTDQDQRTGEVVHNHQFQFDNPVQGPITSGFSVCSNGSLALHGSAIWYGCASGNFSNLYDQDISVGEGSQCHQVYIVAYPCSGSGATPVASGGASSTSSSSSSTSASSTPVAPPTTLTTSTPLPTPAPATSAAPFPVGNSTAPAPTASKATTTTSATATSTTAATFRGAANVVAVGGKVVAVVAGIAAFALF